jgi:hypothetical protein
VPTSLGLGLGLGSGLQPSSQGSIGVGRNEEDSERQAVDGQDEGKRLGGWLGGNGPLNRSSPRRLSCVTCGSRPGFGFAYWLAADVAERVAASTQPAAHRRRFVHRSRSSVGRRGDPDAAAARCRSQSCGRGTEKFFRGRPHAACISTALAPVSRSTESN